MLNGSGLRVVLWLSGCNHNCYNCQNPQTHDCNSGIPFDISARQEIFDELKKDYIKGITFSGGDPLHENNLTDVHNLCVDINEKFPTKDIWLYTGYTFEELNEDIGYNSLRQKILSMCDVLVDGRYVESLRDKKCPWVGSTNQRVIDMKKTIKLNQIVLWSGERK